MNENSQKRYVVRITGIVQGVGFRPHVHKCAVESSINGWVMNDGGSVIMDIQGSTENIKSFLLNVVRKPPALAWIDEVTVSAQQLIVQQGFSIRESGVREKAAFFLPDTGICEDCLKEVLTPGNRRYGYAFTNCTACGPRYSILMRFPYDRVNTSMVAFPMCLECSKEYADPEDRRFHAETNCCPHCGPKLWLTDSNGKILSEDNPIKATINLLRQGKILAIKGIGGFHLACDATNEQAVSELRKRKNRPHKPFAVMVKDLSSAQSVCNLSDMELRILQSPQKPIVLAKSRHILSDGVAPNLLKLGVMLPYTPLHNLLFQSGLEFLVMTSGNMGGDPIEYVNESCISRLGHIADFFLMHNRDILTPVEDSVVKVVDGKECIIRLGRGYAPALLPMECTEPILAMGAELKNSFAICKDGYAHISEYHGDLQNYNSRRLYEKAIENIIDTLNCKPNIMAVDLRDMEKQEGINNVCVQHHHAHMASCMAEHEIYQNVIGVIFDGTGVGTDNTIWGGEFLVGNRKEFIRAGCLEPVKIQGGDQAVKEPWRTALSYLYVLGEDGSDLLPQIEQYKQKIVVSALRQNLNCFISSSMGRLFDCVSALLEICHTVSYDGQAAIELESIANPDITEAYTSELTLVNGTHQLAYQTLLMGILHDLSIGVPVCDISAKFHNAIVNATVRIVNNISAQYGIKDVVLSGGVFENEYLLSRIIKELRTAGYHVYYNQKVPINDNGLSLGQLAVAASRMAERGEDMLCVLQ